VYPEKLSEQNAAAKKAAKAERSPAAGTKTKTKTAEACIGREPSILL
jgi:hypothetical protein